MFDSFKLARSPLNCDIRSSFLQRSWNLNSVVFHLEPVWFIIRHLLPFIEQLRNRPIFIWIVLDSVLWWASSCIGVKSLVRIYLFRIVIHESNTLLGNAVLLQVGERVWCQICVEYSSINPLLLFRCSNHGLFLQCICYFHIVSDLLICSSLIFVVNGVTGFYFTQIRSLPIFRIVEIYRFFIDSFNTGEWFFSNSLCCFQIVHGSSILVCAAHVTQLVGSHLYTGDIADLTLVIVAYRKVILLRSFTTNNAAIEICGILVSAYGLFLLKFRLRSITVFRNIVTSMPSTKIVTDPTCIIRLISPIFIKVADHVGHIAIILEFVLLSEFSQFVYHSLLFHL